MSSEFTSALPKSSSTRAALFDYAFVGSYPKDTVFVKGEKPSVKASFTNTLMKLKEMAMDEPWEYSRMENQFPLPILYNYIIHTFARLQEEKKILEVDGYSCFNTGLVTTNQEEIFMLFRKTNKDTWAFSEFCKDSSHSLMKFSSLPQRASYFNDYSELIYNPTIDLRINIDHIVDDQDNFARFPQDIQQWPKHQLINTFNGAIEHAKKRVKRNHLTAIPQYYRGKYTPLPQLQLLLPLCLKEPSKADLALAVYRNGGVYNGRTCLTLDMAINNARLISKPDDEWLKP